MTARRTYTARDRERLCVPARRQRKPQPRARHVLCSTRPQLPLRKS